MPVPVGLRTGIAPWLSIQHGARAVEFYKAAFRATELYRFAGGEGLIVKLSVEGADFWLSSDDSTPDDLAPIADNGAPVRMILTVADPDTVFQQAIAAGASEVFPVGEQHGWRLGRLVDPFGHSWEIGYPLRA